MCGKVRRHHKPGDLFQLISNKGIINVVWGFNKGRIYNCRVERLNTTWRNICNNRAILYANYFTEGKQEFMRRDGNPFVLGCLFKGNEFSIVTCDSNKVIKPYHHRMPICIENDSIESWLSSNLSKTNVSDDMFVGIH